MYSETKYLNLILGRLFAQHKRLHFLQNLTWIGILFVSSLLLFVVLDHTYGLQDRGRILFAAWLYGSFTFALFWGLFRPLFSHLNPVFTAQTLEKNYPEFEHRLVAFYGTEEKDIRAKILSQQSLEILSQVDLENPYKKEHKDLLVATLIFSVALIALFFYGFISHKSVFTSLSRALFPSSAVNAPTRTHLLTIHPGHCVLAKGDTLKVSASFEMPGNFFPKEAYLLYSENLQTPLQYKTPLLAKEGNSFEQEIGPLYHHMRYAVQIDDARSEIFSVTILNRPLVESFSLTVTPPRYFQQSPFILEAPYIVPEGSKITIKGTSSKTLKAGYLVLGDQQIPLQIKRPITDTEQFELTFSATQSTFFSFLLLDTDGLYNHPKIRYPLKVLEEEAPKVDFFQPNQDMLLLPTEQMLFEVKATHPTGIHSLTMVTQKGKEIRREVVWTQESTQALQKEFLYQTLVTTETFQLLPGEHVSVHFEAKSLNPEQPKIGKSERRLLTSQVPPASHHFFLEQLAQQLASAEQEQQDSNTQQENSNKTKKTEKNNQEDKSGTAKNSNASKNTEASTEQKEQGSENGSKQSNAQNQSSEKQNPSKDTNGDNSTKSNSQEKENNSQENSQEEENNPEVNEASTENKEKNSEPTEKENEDKQDKSQKHTRPENNNPKNDSSKNNTPSTQENKATNSNKNSSSKNQEGGTEEKQNDKNAESQSANSAGGGGGNTPSEVSTQEALLTELSKQMLQGKVDEAVLRKLGLTREEFQKQVQAFQRENIQKIKNFEPIQVEIESAPSIHLQGSGTQQEVLITLDKTKIENVFDQFRGKIPSQYEAMVQAYFQEMTQQDK